jgi:phage FluMu protein Com
LRFICPTCQQLLGISSRKIGAQVKCPKCRTALIVPHPEEGSAEAQGADSPAADEVWADLTAFDQPPPAPLAKSSPSTLSAASTVNDDPSMVVLPRRMFYFQGILIALVGIVALVAGYLIGSAVRLTGP